MGYAHYANSQAGVATIPAYTYSRRLLLVKATIGPGKLLARVNEMDPVVRTGSRWN